MSNQILKLVTGVMLTAFMLVIAACSAVPSPLQQALAPATPIWTDTPIPPTATDTPAPAPTAGSTPQTANKQGNGKKQNLNVPNALRTLGLTGGVVTSNSNNALGVKLGKNTDQLSYTQSTIVVVAGKTTALPSDIQVGDRVIADVPDNSANSSATFLLDLPPSITPQNILNGAVQTSANGTVTFTTRVGKQLVATSNSTVVVNVVNKQPALGTLADLTRGKYAFVVGQPNGNTMNAQVVVLVDRPVAPNKNNRTSPTPTPTPKPGA
jgi:hypothetical protein